MAIALLWRPAHSVPSSCGRNLTLSIKWVGWQSGWAVWPSAYSRYRHSAFMLYADKELTDIKMLPLTNTQIMKKQMKILASIVLTVMLTGCATQPVQQSPAALHQSHGYVVVHIPLVIGADPVNVTLRALSSGAEFSLLPTTADSLVRALWVPPGTYEIADMVGAKKGTYTPIEVAAGKVTDLGGLTWAGVGERERVLLPIRHPDIAVELDAATRPIKQFVSAEPMLWRPSATPQAQHTPSATTNLGLIADLLTVYMDHANKTPVRAQLRSAKDIGTFTKLFKSAAPGALRDPGYGNDGALYIGANFGQLKKRDNQGVWSSLDTGAISPITAIDAGAGRLLAGTVDGILLASTDNEQTWKRLHRFASGETILSINLSGNRYFILTGQFTTPASLQVYTLDLASQTAPVFNHKIALPPDLPFFRLPSLRGLMAGKYYLVNGVGSVERLDVETLEWTKLTMPHDASHLRATTGGTILTAFKAQGIFSKLSYSTDFGTTWINFETPPYPVNDIQMETPSSGFASRWDTGAFTVALQLTQYDPVSNSWQPTWTAPSALCARTIRDSAGKEQFCVSTGGSILRIGSGKPVPEFVAE